MKFRFITEGSRRRKVFARICEICSKEFYVRQTYKQKFCSRNCYNSKNKVTISCTLCKRIIIRAFSKLKNSKHGYYFCNRICKEKAQKLGGLKQIQPKHYGNALFNVGNYRKLAFDKLINKCNNCGYEKHKNVLVVHHKDRNRKNSNIDNLEILCPTCHIEKHAFDY